MTFARLYFWSQPLRVALILKGPVLAVHLSVSLWKTDSCLQFNLQFLESWVSSILFITEVSFFFFRSMSSPQPLLFSVPNNFKYLKYENLMFDGQTFLLSKVNKSLFQNQVWNSSCASRLYGTGLSGWHSNLWRSWFFSAMEILGLLYSLPTLVYSPP